MSRRGRGSGVACYDATVALRFSRLALGLTAALSFQPDLAAQTAPETRLRPATATVADEFSNVLTIRELADGRILIGDSRDARVVVADLSIATVVQIGRIGHGPGEYPNVRALFRLGRDSSLMVDRLTRRWTTFEGARIGGLVSPDAPSFRATQGSVVGTDTVGFGLAEILQDLTALRGGRRDSVTLIRVRFQSGDVDTVARMLALPAQYRVGGVDRNPTSFTRTVAAFAVGEAALLQSDGWLAIARLNPYRIDWRSPSGVWTFGPPLPFREVAVDARERAAYMERYAATAGRLPRSQEHWEWATTVPPFERDPLYSAPDGSVLIARTLTSSQPERVYDLVDRRGRLVSKVVLDPSERIVGFGVRSVYTVFTQDDGVQRVRRHPWP